MAIKKAKILTSEQFDNLLSIVSMGLHPERDRVMLGLSFKCGLRSKEIAGLQWDDVTDAMGSIIPAGEIIELSHQITKGSKAGSKIILHPFVHHALVDLKAVEHDPSFIIHASRGGQMSPNNVTVYLHNLYQNNGFKGCSSHSGRRTFGTALARKCNEFGGSIADVQELMRHADIRTTRAYLDPSDTQRNLINSL